jgi:hypothetical protein
MNANSIFSEQTAAGWLLILSWIIFMPGGVLYAGSNIWNWPIKNTHRYLLWERGFVMTALLSAVVGFSILEGMLAAAGDKILAPAGMALLLIGAAVVIFAEAYSISRQEWLYAPTVVFVILAFLAQALFGGALLRTGLLPGWIGWLTILWNLGWLVILPMARPKDMYYPWLHYMAPILIGIGLLIK